MTLGWVAICYGASAVFALAVACCGPSRAAKGVAAYLFASWLVSNRVFGVDLTRTMETFSILDFFGSAGLVVLLCAVPARWLYAIFMATIVQMLLHVAYLSGDQTPADAYSNVLENNILFAFQLVMVVVPTFRAKQRRRRSAARRARSSRAASTMSMIAMTAANE